MTNDQQNLWLKIKRFELDDDEADFTFSDRLARENGWTLQYALRAIEEYKKFILLICVCEHPCTPSDQVDQVWHLHLIYTESYWKDFCCDVLGREIHHGPTKGGGSEKVKYADLYEMTLLAYTKMFGSKPPEDIWPTGKIRFSEIHFSRINRHTNWVLSKPKIFVKTKK